MSPPPQKKKKHEQTNKCLYKQSSRKRNRSSVCANQPQSTLIFKKRVPRLLGIYYKIFEFVERGGKKRNISSLKQYPPNHTERKACNKSGRYPARQVNKMCLDRLPIYLYKFSSDHFKRLPSSMAASKR